MESLYKKAGPVMLDLRAHTPLHVGISEHYYTFADGHDSFIEVCSTGVPRS